MAKQDNEILRLHNGIYALILLGAIVTGCGGGGGGGGGGSTTSGTVTTHLSDPAPCTDQFRHVWVAVSDVEAHTDPSAGSGFQDLTPNLTNNPKQVDLLSAPDTECFLATLGSTSGLPPGTYQQIRFLLLANAPPPSGVTAPSPNACASLGADVFNCVQLTDNSFHALSLPSEAKTGIKIPPGQIAGGGLTIAAGQGVDLDIDFNACTSVVQAGKSGNFNLKPTLRAAEVGTSPLIAGKIVEASVNGTSVAVPSPSPTPVAGANVWLERQSHSASVQGGGTDTVENLIQITTTDSTGHFEFCPVGAGTYEVVADSASLPTSSNPSNATVTTGVNVSGSGGPNNLVIPLVPEVALGVGLPATIQGRFTTTNASSPPGTGDDVLASALQPFSSGGGTIEALVPFFSANTVPVPPVVTTTSNGTGTGGPDCLSGCPANTNCACYQLSVPASNPVVGASSTNGGGYSAPAGGLVNYSVDGAATQIGSSSNISECSPSESALPLFSVSGGFTTTASDLNFSGCD